MERFNFFVFCFQLIGFLNVQIVFLFPGKHVLQIGEQKFDLFIIPGLVSKWLTFLPI